MKGCLLQNGVGKGNKSCVCVSGRHVSGGGTAERVPWESRQVPLSTAGTDLPEIFVPFIFLPDHSKHV